MLDDFVLGGQLFKSNYYSIGDGVFKKKNRWMSDDFAEKHFRGRVPNGPDQLDKVAASLSGASRVEYILSVGCGDPPNWAYSVICSGRAKGKPNLTFSFEEAAYPPETSIMKLARKIHGDLIPAKETYYGIMEGSNPPLHMYSKICYVDFSCDEYSMESACTVMKIFPPDEKPRLLHYVRSLAR